MIEDQYDVTDAVVVGSLLISLLRHSDRVTAACQAQLVNVIAPIRSEAGGPAWRQTIFHPFAITSRLARGQVLRVEPQGPVQETERFGEVPVVDAVATHDPETGEVSVFLVNRHLSEPVTLAVPLAGFELGTFAVTERGPSPTPTSRPRTRPRSRTGWFRWPIPGSRWRTGCSGWSCRRCPGAQSGSPRNSSKEQQTGATSDLRCELGRLGPEIRNFCVSGHRWCSGWVARYAFSGQT